jgi:MoCo/4Fe-4S cofactor protein with predicted Tat translocation signal
MTCHSEIWTNSSMLEPVRASFMENKPIHWTRVNTLPQFVYFDHSIHISKGIGCTTCHGPIGNMPLTWQGGELKMAWCLNCHRHPENYVRPKDKVFDVHYAPPANQRELGKRLVKEYNIYWLTDCDMSSIESDETNTNEQRPRDALDLPSIQAKLQREGNQRFWRCLEEVANTPQYESLLQNEFTHNVEGQSAPLPGTLSRRDALRVMAASAASAAIAGLSGLHQTSDRTHRAIRACS